MDDQRCFIVGSGNSIGDIDLKLLKNENIIFLNSFLHHDQYSDLIKSNKGKKFHVFTPLHEFKNKKILENYIDEFKNPILKHVTCFFGIDDFSTNYIEEFKKKNLEIHDSSFYVYCTKKYDDIGSISPDDFELSKNIWSPKTSSNLALQIAIYMNFNEIYLIGIDHDYMNTKHSENIKIIKKGTLVEDEQDQWNDLLDDGRINQTSFLKDLIPVIKPMEIIEKKFPGRVKNLSKRSFFYCHDQVDISDLEFE